jgi:multisubunit Na+/H+ antiporter MnhC subunit
MAASPLACMMKVMVYYSVSDAHKIMTTLVLVVFVGTYIMVSFKVLLWIILCTLTDMGVFLFWGVFGDFLITSMVIS